MPILPDPSQLPPHIHHLHVPSSKPLPIFVPTSSSKNLPVPTHDIATSQTPPPPQPPSDPHPSLPPASSPRPLPTATTTRHSASLSFSTVASTASSSTISQTTSDTPTSVSHSPRLAAAPVSAQSATVETETETATATETETAVLTIEEVETDTADAEPRPTTIFRIQLPMPALPTSVVPASDPPASTPSVPLFGLHTGILIGAGVGGILFLFVAVAMVFISREHGGSPRQRRRTGRVVIGRLRRGFGGKGLGCSGRNGGDATARMLEGTGAASRAEVEVLEVGEGYFGPGCGGNDTGAWARLGVSSAAEPGLRRRSVELSDPDFIEPPPLARLPSSPNPFSDPIATSDTATSRSSSAFSDAGAAPAAVTRTMPWPMAHDPNAPTLIRPEPPAPLAFGDPDATLAVDASSLIRPIRARSGGADTTLAWPEPVASLAPPPLRCHRTSLADPFGEAPTLAWPAAHESGADAAMESWPDPASYDAPLSPLGACRRSIRNVFADADSDGDGTLARPDSAPCESSSPPVSARPRSSRDVFADPDSDGGGTLAWPASASRASPQPSLGAQVQNAFADDTDSDRDGTLAWPARASRGSPQPSLGAQVQNAFADDTDSDGDETVTWPHSHTHDAADDEPQQTLALPDTDHPHGSPLSPRRRSIEIVFADDADSEGDGTLAWPHHRARDDEELDRTLSWPVAADVHEMRAGDDATLGWPASVTRSDRYETADSDGTLAWPARDEGESDGGDAHEYIDGDDATLGRPGSFY
ncbi:hypothetical protein BDK51DRAFT_27111 [Blyttiomyces helicus]|uniref:Uncharacterized protein n=1 Tax=Blyttiomyces helicus TaxID=388810 RepID=A0A4P9W6H7_9FUNG|nr:hypothetical protein BDK51DRAFT_27111 [Blyttiomyces helicus]|eukprot:RKO88061.1 hypothetical protein BDK51DRAFT_27111 [Blyttiomyces helicus]